MKTIKKLALTRESVRKMELKSGLKTGFMARVASAGSAWLSLTSCGPSVTCPDE
jgi:hypothetical protein